MSVGSGLTSVPGKFRGLYDVYPSGFSNHIPTLNSPVMTGSQNQRLGPQSYKTHAKLHNFKAMQYEPDRRVSFGGGVRAPNRLAYRSNPPPI